MSALQAVPAGHTPEPSPFLFHAAMLLSGFGTVFLGPVLPALAASAHTTDSGSGLFFTAQFIGAFFGGITTSHRLFFCLVRGLSAATAGFLLLALCAGLHAGVFWDAAALVPLGFGVGQMLTSVNLLAAQRYQEQRSSALSLINFTWSLGAVTAPFLLGSILSSASLMTVLGVVTILFVVVLTWAAWSVRGGLLQEQQQTRHTESHLPRTAFLSFAAMLLLYGGVETCLSGWITTFGTRYGNATLRISTLGATALWIGITGGRALAPLLLKFLRERIFLIATLSAAMAMVALLSRSSGAASITLLSALLGLSLAAWFPLVLSSMLNRGASARETGIIIALSGIGAAILPLLLGVVSRSTGSLRTALAIPFTGLVLLILLAFFTRSSTQAKSV
ncbi:sugar MFS transporter [Terriglobus sp. RCC_193]|uniref:MFS transporter n=1 Tax=Terriglobus sp. RCC_193 TaxID=3239218 RepID=UPI0035259BE6